MSDAFSILGKAAKRGIKREIAKRAAEQKRIQRKTEKAEAKEIYQLIENMRDVLEYIDEEEDYYDDDATYLEYLHAEMNTIITMINDTQEKLS